MIDVARMWKNFPNDKRLKEFEGLALDMEKRELELRQRIVESQMDSRIVKAQIVRLKKENICTS